MVLIVLLSLNNKIGLASQQVLFTFFITNI